MAGSFFKKKACGQEVLALSMFTRQAPPRHLKPDEAELPRCPSTLSAQRYSAHTAGRSAFSQALSLAWVSMTTGKTL
jgi:hypothetical protein